MSRRGRPPRSPGLVKKHLLIGRVAWQMHLWGYSIEPGGVLNHVAKAALSVLGVGGHGSKQPLSEDRVRQLMHEWKEHEERAAEQSWADLEWRSDQAGQAMMEDLAKWARRAQRLQRASVLREEKEQRLARTGDWSQLKRLVEKERKALETDISYLESQQRIFGRPRLGRSGRLVPPVRASDYTKSSRRNEAPRVGMTPLELAEKLFKHLGEWPPPVTDREKHPVIIAGDLERTPSAEREYQERMAGMPRIQARRSRKPGN